ncbi:patatin [Brachionus plicatilis]|uniref:Patatin n=1 Tax=Brachionus plicatilis TaxID=10195 RepID=A0A3M7PDP3_BRAPC|nr:patatin [Brachionus plicatilis]
MDAFEQKGDEYCNIAIDYYNRSQGKPGLKCLNPIDLANLTKEELTNQAKHYSYLSFNEYMNACKLADKLCASDKQLLFRHKMAMAQYISENMLEAQLICIAQIFMMNKFRHKKIPISGQATVNLDTIIRKIERKCKGLSMRTDKPADEKVFDKNQITANEVKDLVVYEASEDAEKNIEDKFKNSIILLLNKDSYNTKIALSKIESNINSIHSSIRNCQIATFSSTAFAVVQGAEIYLSWGTIAASGLFVGSLFILGAFITSYGTYYLWNNRRGMLKNEKKKYEASIKLNEILNNVFSYYKNEQFDKLLEELTRSYEDGKSLISFNKYTIRLDPTSMAEELLDYEFPPDGIAYIFNLIATVLFSGKVKPRGNLSENDFQMKAKELLSYVADEKSKLFEKCKELNENMKKINWRYGYFFHKQHIDSKIEYHNNLIKITEAQFIAKVNLILLTIAMNGLNIRNEEIIKNMLNDLDVFAKDKANFVDISTSSCLELVQFIFSVFNIEMPTKEESFKKKEDFDYDEKGINIIYEQKELLRFLTIRIENEKEQKCKGHQYVARATVYHDIALGKLKAQFDQHKFFYFNKARKDFEEAFTLNNDEMKTRKNIFMFSEVKEFIKILQANGNVDIDDEIYFYYGITERNMQNYKDAFQYFRMALIKFKDVKNDEKTKECLRELEIARSLQNESKTQQLSQIYETDFERFKILGEQVFAKKNSNKFRIISIDGGGVRGIIPAMILREIQRRLSYPLVSVVDMFAGTSTGAILAAGLNVPIRDGSRIPKYSPNDIKLEHFYSKIFYLWRLRTEELNQLSSKENT